MAARNKDTLFPKEGVPAWIMAILYADPISAGLARGGRVRLEPGSGLTELRIEWPRLVKRVMTSI